MKNFDSTLTLKNRPELRFSEIESHADFSRIRYAQCWEDADILLKALGVKAGGQQLIAFVCESGKGNCSRFQSSANCLSRTKSASNQVSLLRRVALSRRHSCRRQIESLCKASSTPERKDKKLFRCAKTRSFSWHRTRR